MFINNYVYRKSTIIVDYVFLASGIDYVTNRSISKVLLFFVCFQCEKIENRFSEACSLMCHSNEITFYNCQNSFKKRFPSTVVKQHACGRWVPHIVFIRRSEQEIMLSLYNLNDELEASDVCLRIR